ncbi:hypothetical protein T440DRAFT_468578 [Plenodomus tracheiphilus IPT5]|uniref:Uncharacterized protein n=1 Tax=Plenodomus tracheiphilus IPT5 TaxID=1408161 RepID=A0A6A7B3Y3_9PLEO|nr:hypothetical protein T440DRAFT_468578 [Plenodomus tracheiphilus IPT5]
MASLICPSAPFLAPRLLRPTVPIAIKVPQTAPQATYATAPDATRGDRKSTSRKGKPLNKPWKMAESSKERALAQSFGHLVMQFREACETRNVHQVMDLYPTLLEAGVLNAYDTRRITQTLHVRIRLASDHKKRAELFTFVQKVVADLASGALEPQHYAYVHLFGIFKDCKRYEEGHHLWQWLVDQDERHVSAAAYGAAIELLAYGRLMQLPDLESLYLEGLRRFPGTFAEYHLSPEAIVPDRTRPTFIAGIPMILLQGILTARMLARDWKNAYLALDTALRLYPHQLPPRYFELFMAERPLSEAYTAYMLACRAGITIRATHVTALLAKMRAAIGVSRSMADRMMLVRAMANALYASVEAGDELQSIHVGVFIQAMTQLLPEDNTERGVRDDEVPLRDAIVAAVHEITSGLMQAGFKAHIHPFDALITLSGKLRVPSLLTSTLQDLKTANIELGPIATRDAISAAGLLGNTDVIEQLWEEIVTKAENESSGIGFGDWISLTKACRRAHHTEYFWAQLARLPHAIEQGVENHIKKQIDQADTVFDAVAFEYMTVEDLSTELDQLKSQTKNIEAVLLSGQPLDIVKNPINMHLDPNHAPLASTDNMRIVYDQYSTDPHQPPPEESKIPISLSPTGIPLDELRFQNWVTIMESMSDAEAYEISLQATIDAAHKSGEPLTGRPEILQLRQDPSVQYSTINGLRTRISNLRTSVPVEVPRFRYAVSRAPQVGIDAPMAYDESRGKWRVRSGRLVKYTTPPAREDLKPVRDGALTVPTLSYYLGLESNHNAPMKKPKSILGIQRRGPGKDRVDDEASAGPTDEQSGNDKDVAAAGTSTT